jgi:hypothetical protein
MTVVNPSSRRFFDRFCLEFGQESLFCLGLFPALVTGTVPWHNPSCRRLVFSGQMIWRKSRNNCRSNDHFWATLICRPKVQARMKWSIMLRSDLDTRRCREMGPTVKGSGFILQRWDQGCNDHLSSQRILSAVNKLHVSVIGHMLSDCPLHPATESLTE